MEQRLIDANELKEWVADWLKVDKYYHPHSRSKSIPITELHDILDRIPTVDAVPVDFINALHTDYVQRSKALQGRTGYMYTLYAIALENLVQSFDYDNAMADEMKTERFCADGERKDGERKDDEHHGS